MLSSVWASCPQPSPPHPLLPRVAQTFSAQVPVECAVLRETTATLVALEGFLACVVPHMPHQGALLPEASAAELAHVGLFFQMCPEVHLLGILGRLFCDSLFSTVSPYPPGPRG